MGHHPLIRTTNLDIFSRKTCMKRKVACIELLKVLHTTIKQQKRRKVMNGKIQFTAVFWLFLHLTNHVF